MVSRFHQGLHVLEFFRACEIRPSPRHGIDMNSGECESVGSRGPGIGFMSAIKFLEIAN